MVASPWRDAVPLEQPEDDLGGSFHWAFGALGRNIGPLVLIALVTVGAVLVASALAFGIVAIALLTGIALFSVVGWFLAAALVFATVTWAALAHCRAWSMAARGVAVRVGESLQPEGYVGFMVTMLLIAPLTVLTGMLGTGFALTALLIAAGDGLGPSGSFGRMLAETCGSARRFFHTLLIGVVDAVYLWTVWVLWVFAFYSILLGSAASAASDAFSEASEVGGAERGVTLVLGGFGVTVAYLVAVVAVGNLVGLWSAARLRRLTGRPLGAIVRDAAELEAPPR